MDVLLTIRWCGRIWPNLGLQDFGAPATHKQDFNTCVAATHISWMLNYHAYAADAGYVGAALAVAETSVAGMGYNFRVTGVVATVADADDGGCAGSAWQGLG